MGLKNALLHFITLPSLNKDKIKEYNNHIFLSFDLKNYRKSNWWIKTANTLIKDKITIRTANTVKKLLELCQNKHQSIADVFCFI